MRSLRYWSSLNRVFKSRPFFLTTLSFLWWISAKHNFSLELVLYKKCGPVSYLHFLLFPSYKIKWQQTLKSSSLKVADAESHLKQETRNYIFEYSPVLAEAVNIFTSWNILVFGNACKSKLIAFTVEKLHTGSTYLKETSLFCSRRGHASTIMPFFLSISTLNTTKFFFSLSESRWRGREKQQGKGKKKTIILNFKSHSRNLKFYFTEPEQGEITSYIQNFKQSVLSLTANHSFQLQE